MGKVIADATVISNYVLIKRLDLLQKVVANLCTTREVFEELRFGVERGIFPASDLGQIEVLEMNSEERKVFSKLADTLGRGESSCIAIALTRGFKMLTDDLDARKYAQRFGVPVSGTIGVLVLAVNGKIISKEQGNRLLSEMIRMGFYSSIESLDEILT
ncbi:MAG: DUF3368 domain-containing protein [Candidatus Freyarchaeota archaeon]